MCVHVPWPEYGGQRAALEVSPHVFHLVCGSGGFQAFSGAPSHITTGALGLQTGAAVVWIYMDGNLNSAFPHCVLR